MSFMNAYATNNAFFPLKKTFIEKSTLKIKSSPLAISSLTYPTHFVLLCSHLVYEFHRLFLKKYE